MEVIPEVQVEVASGGDIDAAKEGVFVSPRFIEDGDVADFVFEDDTLSVAVEAKVC